jgi:hypothetical protein
MFPQTLAALGFNTARHRSLASAATSDLPRRRPSVIEKPPLELRVEVRKVPELLVHDPVLCFALECSPEFVPPRSSALPCCAPSPPLPRSFHHPRWLRRVASYILVLST